MSEDEALVWYEADGTRHVLGESSPSPFSTPAVPEPAGAEAAGRVIEKVRPERTDADVPPPPVGKVAPEQTRAEAAAPPAEPGDEESSAIRGMVRALLLGAAAAAATGAVVGAISLAATGDRPDTADDTVVPATFATEAEPAATGPPSTVETIELAPPTTSADQPG